MVRMFSPVEAVSRSGDGLSIGGSLPIGLLCAVRFQPHRGENLHQAFIAEMSDGVRLLAWRLDKVVTDSEDLESSTTVFTPIDDNEWVALLKKRTNVAATLVPDRAAVAVTIERRLGAGGAIAIEPARSRDLIRDEHLPSETLPPDRDDPDRKLRSNPVFWLALRAGVRLEPSRHPAHAAELEQLERWQQSGPQRQATLADGSHVAAYQHLFVTTEADGGTVVRRHPGQLDARTAVDLAVHE